VLACPLACHDRRSLTMHACMHMVCRGACSLRAVDACRGPKWLRWLGLAPRACSGVRGVTSQLLQAV
jgi:hypothetical protein